GPGSDAGARDRDGGGSDGLGIPAARGSGSEGIAQNAERQDRAPLIASALFGRAFGRFVDGGESLSIGLTVRSRYGPLKPVKTVVAHALVRAASRLLWTRGPEHRHECRCGTQECMRHILRKESVDFQRDRSYPPRESCSPVPARSSTLSWPLGSMRCGI